LDRRTIDEISQALEDFRLEKRVRGIVLTGSGSHFCSGLDLAELHKTADDEEALQQWFSDCQGIQSLIEQMLQCPKPIVAAVDGKSLGSGLALVLASDLVVASHRASFAIPATKLGLVSGLVLPLLHFRCGASLASRLSIGLGELSAAEARQAGLVHECVEADQVWVRATNWIQDISESASEAVQLTKKVLNETVGEHLSTMLASGAAATATALTTEAAREGLLAFQEKRSPSFP
jgi:enoyl-CoA hydratase/carnithine racemase